MIKRVTENITELKFRLINKIRTLNTLPILGTIIQKKLYLLLFGTHTKMLRMQRSLTL